VPDKEKERIFRREYFKNTGFGLFLSREILAITNLTIHETGVFGEGVRFIVEVPRSSYRQYEVLPENETVTNTGTMNERT
jgi:signal transduction histidine kinase